MNMVPWYHEYSWVFLSAHKPHSWEHRSSHESSWVLMALWHHAQEYSWLILAAHGCLFMIMSACECSRLLIMSRHYHPRGFMGNRQGMAPWWQERSWTLIGPKKLLWAWCREHAWASEHHRTILLSAPKYSWVLRSTPEFTWMFMIAQVLNLTINKQKMLSFEMTSL